METHWSLMNNKLGQEEERLTQLRKEFEKAVQDFHAGKRDKTSLEQLGQDYERAWWSCSKSRPGAIRVTFD
jgi:hypothetical protein